MAENRSLVESWPPVMIVHGVLDAIVPVEHSFHFLSSLLLLDKKDIPHASSVENIIVEEIISIDGSVIVNGKDSVSPPDYSDKTKLSSREGEGSVKATTTIMRDNDLRARAMDSTGESISVNKNKGDRDRDRDRDRREGITSSTPLLTLTPSDSPSDPMWKMRVQDLIVTIPGAKHSFEAVGGETLDIVCEGVITWAAKAIRKPLSH